jgi:hypothetical protein
VASQKFHENEEVKNKVIVACTGGRVLWRRNTKTRNQATPMPWERWWLCRKIGNDMC